MASGPEAIDRLVAYGIEKNRSLLVTKPLRRAGLYIAIGKGGGAGLLTPAHTLNMAAGLFGCAPKDAVDFVRRVRGLSIAAVTDFRVYGDGSAIFHVEHAAEAPLDGLRGRSLGAVLERHIEDLARDPAGTPTRARARLTSSPTITADVAFLATAEQVDESGRTFRLERRVRFASTRKAGLPTPERVTVFEPAFLEFLAELARERVVLGEQMNVSLHRLIVRPKVTAEAGGAGSPKRKRAGSASTLPAPKTSLNRRTPKARSLHQQRDSRGGLDDAQASRARGGSGQLQQSGATHGPSSLAA